MTSVDRRRMAWFAAAWLAVLAVLGVIKGTMPGLIFALAMIAVALFCAAKGYARESVDRSPSRPHFPHRRIGPIVGYKRHAKP